MATPYSLTVLEETTSTQDEARRRFQSPRPSVVVAHRQLAGRGRSGAGWRNAPRAVAMSVAFRLPHDAMPTTLIPLMAGVAAHRVMGPSVHLKWPNDVEIDDRKVAGILVEAATFGDGSRPDPLVVAGMGVNLHWPDPPPGVGGLHSDDPGPELGPRLGVAWAETLLELAETPSPWPLQGYRDICSTLGRALTWEPDGRGRAVDIDREGALIVETDRGVIRLTSGAVQHVRPDPNG